MTDPATALSAATAGAVSAIGGLIAGAVLAFKFAKNKATALAIEMVENTTAEEMVAIIESVKKIKSRESEGGIEVTDRELLRLGDQIYKAVRD